MPEEPTQSTEVNQSSNSKSVLGKNVPNPLAKSPNFYTHKVFASVGLILIGVIVVLFGAAIIFKVNLSDLFSNSTSTDTKVATSSAKTDPTANWKKFTHATFSVEFRIPQDWSTLDICPSCKGSPDTLMIAPKTRVDYVKTLVKGGFEGGSFLVITLNKLDKKEELDGFEIVNKESIRINDKLATKYTLKDPTLETWISVEIEDNTKFFYLDLLDLNYQKEFDNIVSTFKFTN